MNKFNSLLIVLCLVFLIAGISELFAQQLVYQPVNPSFGGSPLNGSWLLSSAQLQDLTTDPATETTDDPLADFEENLNRTILNQISRQISESLFGTTGIQEGQFEFGDFMIDVTETISGLSIVIFDVVTGNETSIFIPYP